MKPINIDWTPERVAELKRLFAEGLSFERIAGDMAMSRNAIMGKCRRLELKRDPLLKHEMVKKSAGKKAHQHKLHWNPGKKQRPRWDPRRNSQAQKIQAGPKINIEAFPPTPASDLEIPKRRRKNIWTLGPRDCKFPIGDPGTSSFFFCGAKRVAGLPYCESHSCRCFHPARGT